MVQGWHRGELAIQKKLGYDGPMAIGYSWIEQELPEEHRVFHSTRLPFIPVTTLDDTGRPWSCILAGSAGEPGFVSSPNWDRLDMDVRVWPGDPFKENINLFGTGQKILAAGIGIEFSTRRRNKFAGYISDVRKHGDSYQIKLIVNQAIGNCPKYINVRDLAPHPDTNPTVVHRVPRLGFDDRLPDELIAFVHAADTVFIGSSYQALKAEEGKNPSHAGQNQRGGKPGFVRVRPSDGKTIVLPDYSGNRFMTSLGNIEATPLASLTIVDFVTGDILYMTGIARTLVGQPAQEIMPRQNVITLLTVTGYTFVRDALPVRQRPGTSPERSPYSPPVRLLAEETSPGSSLYFDEQVIVTLAGITLHSRDLATFTWITSKPVHITPGQTAVLDFTELIGAQRYAHMAPWKPTSVNDDRIRTWTVSSADLAPGGTESFALTMREKPGGAVTGALFAIARKLAEARPELLANTRELGLQVKLVGIAGEFKLPIPLALPVKEKGEKKDGADADAEAVSEVSAPSSSEAGAAPMLWVAGGIGVTPYLSMLAAITQAKPTKTPWDIVLALSTREPEVLVPLITEALGSGDSANTNLRLRVDIFTSKPVSSFPSLCRPGGLYVSFVSHQGRIPQGYFDGLEELDAKTAYLCGPEDFEKGVLKMLSASGYNKTVVRESFEY